MDTRNRYDEVVALLQCLYARKRLFLKVFLATCLYVAFTHFTSPKEYTCISTLSPEFGSDNKGSLGSMASLIGVQLPDNDDMGAIRPDLYPQIVSSNLFQTELLNEKVHFVRDEQEVTASIYEYIELHQKGSLLSDLLGSVLAFFKEDKQELDSLDMYRLSVEQEAVYKTIDKMVDVSIESEVSLIDVNVITQDAEVSAQINSLVLTKLQDYVIRYRTKKNREDMCALQEICRQAEQKYNQALLQCGSYADAHRGNQNKSTALEEERLMNAMNMAYQIYSQTQVKAKQAEQRLLEATPVFVVVQEPTVPSKKSGPKLLPFLMSMLVLTMGTTTCCVLFGRKIKTTLDVIRKK